MPLPAAAAQLPAPAPSFVEACMGSAQSTPGAAAIEQAHALLTRLIAQGSAVALKLLGGVSEQPDFLAQARRCPTCSPCARMPIGSMLRKNLPATKSLRWCSSCGRLWTKTGGLTAAEARENLGRELTEAAVLRALCELWQALRISPVFAEPGQPARWELLRVRHRDALATASATSQVTALSLLVSMYLQSVYAASSEEIEVFLSPVASRSRVREAVRGLSATRQIHSLSMDAQTYYFLENGLPEFAEPAASPAAKANAGETLPPGGPWRDMRAPATGDAARAACTSERPGAAAVRPVPPTAGQGLAGLPSPPSRSAAPATGGQAGHGAGQPPAGAAPCEPGARSGTNVRRTTGREMESPRTRGYTA